MPLNPNKRSRSCSTVSSSSSISDDDDLKYRRNSNKYGSRKRSSCNLAMESCFSKSSKLDSIGATAKSRQYSEHGDGSTASHSNQSIDKTRLDSSANSELLVQEQEFDVPFELSPEDDPLASRNLFIGCLANDITCRELHIILKPYGHIINLNIKPKTYGKSACAFVKFLTLDMAYKAKLALSGKDIAKVRCNIEYSHKKIPTSRIWIGGLESSIDLSQIKAEFCRFGEIIKINYIEGDNQGYIWYDSPSAARNAVNEMRGFIFAGSHRRLRTDFADDPPNKFEMVRESSDCNSEIVELIKNCSTVHDIIGRGTVVWQGDLILNDLSHPIKMHLIEGSESIIKELKEKQNGQLIVSDMYQLGLFELNNIPTELSRGSSYAVFLCSSVSKKEASSIRKCVSYFRKEEANGVTYLVNHETQMNGVLFTFPPYTFSIDILKRACPKLSKDSITDDYLIMVATRSQ